MTDSEVTAPDPDYEAIARALYDYDHPNGPKCPCHGFKSEAHIYRKRAHLAVEAMERGRRP